MSEILFHTPRLYCRRWQAEDLEQIYAVYADPEGARWVGDGQPITRDECERWLEVTANNYQTRGYGMFALDEQSSKRTVGFAGLVHPDQQVEPEIKYAFLKSHWGQGLASEVVPALLNYGAAHHGLGEIIATVAQENLPSQRVLTKSGMAYSRAYTEEDGAITQVYIWRADGNV